MNFYNQLRESLDNFEPNVTLSKGETVLLCDMGYIFKYQFAGNPATRGDGIPIGGISGSINLIIRMVNQFSPTKVVCIFDGKASRKRRRNVIQEYKVNRDESAGIRSTLDMSQEMNDESQKTQYKLLFHLMKFMPVKLIKMDELEADDIIGYIANKYYDNKTGTRYIISADKDFHQLVNKRTTCYNPQQKKLINEVYIKKHWATYPENIIYHKIVEGDPSDNLKGINGVGKKTLIKFFPELQEIRINNIEEFIELIQSKEELLCKTKTGKKIFDGIDTLRDNYYVMRLTDEFISLDEAVRINKILERGSMENIIAKKKKLKQLIMKYSLEDDIHTNSLFTLFHKLKY